MLQSAVREKTTIKALGLSGGYGGAPCSVEYKVVLEIAKKLGMYEEVSEGRNIEEWGKQYPEAFAREYDLASGLRFNAWVEKDR
jgi:hypothetical protein